MPGEFMQFYGSTEAGGATSILRPDEHDLEHEDKLKSCGRPLPLIEFRIVDPYDNDVPDGEPGELLIRPPSITTGTRTEERREGKEGLSTCGSRRSQDHTKKKHR